MREALHERGLLYNNAPHLVTNLAFIVPRYKWWEGPFYGIGLKLYDLLAGKLNLAKSRQLNPKGYSSELIPNLEAEGLDGGTEYHDGQFDDATNVRDTCSNSQWTMEQSMLNYAPVTGLLRDDQDHVCGVKFKDVESGQDHEARGAVVINATGVFSNTIRRMDDPDAESMVEPSRGVHLVLDQSFPKGRNGHHGPSYG